jgi:hypothetical protein
MMKFMVILGLAIVVAWGCGDASRGNAIVGQVKRIKQMTPMICPDYVEVDLSLGVLRNGVGSTSREDATLAIDPSDHATIDVLTRASKSGQIVHLTYNERRISPCWPDDRVVDAAIEASADGPPATSAVTSGSGLGSGSLPGAGSLPGPGAKAVEGQGSDGR